jgi:WD40-like Beta Propeller Repeat
MTNLTRRQALRRVASMPAPAFLDRQPVIRRDGLEVFFASNRSPGGYGGLDLWVSTRPTTSDPWLTPVNVGSMVNTIANEAGSALSFDGTTLYFQSVRPIAPVPFDLIVTTRSKLRREGSDQRD